MAEPTPLGDAADGGSGASLTLRIALESPWGTDRSTLLRSLASQAGEPVHRAALDRLSVEVLTFHAGLFGGHPLRLEVVALAGPAAAQERLRRSCDVVVLVVDAAAPSGTTESWLHGPDGRWATGAPLHRPALVVFVHRRDGEAPCPADDPAAGLAAVGEVPVVATSADGDGVRFAFALAVRAGVQRAQARDDAGLGRSAPSDGAALLAGLQPAAVSPASAIPAPPVAAWGGRRRVDPPRPEGEPEPASDPDPDPDVGHDLAPMAPSVPAWLDVVPVEAGAVAPSDVLGATDAEHAGDLEQAETEHADLERADLERADLERADLEHDDLEHDHLEHDDWRERAPRRRRSWLNRSDR